MGSSTLELRGLADAAREGGLNLKSDLLFTRNFLLIFSTLKNLGDSFKNEPNKNYYLDKQKMSEEKQEATTAVATEAPADTAAPAPDRRELQPMHLLTRERRPQRDAAETTVATSDEVARWSARASASRI